MNNFKKVETFELTNGLKVVHNHRPGSGSVSIDLMCRAGSAYEESDEFGAAHFLEHVTMGATLKYPKRGELSSFLGSLGARTGARTNRDVIEYFVQITADKYEAGFDFLSQVSMHSLIPEENIEVEKGVILQEIKRAEQNNQRLAYEACIAELYKEDRMATSNLGTVEAVKNMSRDKLISFKERNFKSGNMTLSVCGDISLQRVTDMAEKYMAEIKKGDIATRQTPEINNSPTLRVINRPGSTQAHVCILFPGFAAGTSEEYVVDFIYTILCFGKDSVLWKAIREKHGLAYVVSGSSLSGGIVGEFGIYTAVSEENINKALSLIGDEIKSFVLNGPSDRDVDRVKNIIKSRSIFNLESSQSMASLCSKLSLIHRQEPNIEKEIEKYISVTKQDIVEVSKKIFDKKPAVAVVSENLSKGDIDIASALHS